MSQHYYSRDQCWWKALNSDGIDFPPEYELQIIRHEMGVRLPYKDNLQQLCNKATWLKYYTHFGGKPLIMRS